MLRAAQTGLPTGGLPPSSSPPALLVTMVTLVSRVTSAHGFLEGAWLVTATCAFQHFSQAAESRDLSCRHIWNAANGFLENTVGDVASLFPCRGRNSIFRPRHPGSTLLSSPTPTLTSTPLPCLSTCVLCPSPQGGLRCFCLQTSSSFTASAQPVPTCPERHIFSTVPSAFPVGKTR